MFMYKTTAFLSRYYQGFLRLLSDRDIVYRGVLNIAKILQIVLYCSGGSRVGVGGGVGWGGVGVGVITPPL